MNDIDRFLEDVRKKNLFLSDSVIKISAKEFVERIEAKASQLPPGGGRVYFPIERTIDSLELFFALIKAGFLVFIGNPTTASGKIASLIQYIQPRFAILRNYQINLLSQPIHVVSTFSDSFFLYRLNDFNEILDPKEKDANVAMLTSGTTGEPKAVLHRFSSLLINASLHADAVELESNDVVGVALPFHFSYGLVAVILGSLVRGSSLLFAPTSLPESLDHSLDNATFFSATPMFIKRMTYIPFRSLTIGGDLTTVSVALHVFEQRPDIKLFVTYGLTEAGPRVFTHRVTLDDCQHGHLPLGDPLKGVTWDLDDQEILVHTPTAMLGYFCRPEETAQVLSNQTIRTGDLAKINNGRLYFIGRKKRLLCRGGEKIYPSELERVLQQFSSIRNAYITMKNDQLIAFIESDGIINEKQLKSHLLRYLPRTQFPDQINYVSQMPEEARKK